MGVKRTTEDAGVAMREAAWPSRFLERTPSLGQTPNLTDEELIELARAARRAARRAFGSGATAPGADETTSPS